MSKAPQKAKSLELDPQALLSGAKKILEVESKAIAAMKERLDGAFVQAIEALLQRPGRPVLLGQGKSGWVSGKLASTFCSIGMPAHFLNAAEAVHGDLGMIADEAVVILVSKSGTTRELVRLIPALRDRRCFLIGLLGKKDSFLASQCDVVLDASVVRESDPLGMVPTTSATAALAMGHALIGAVMSCRKFTPEDYGRLHPAGQIGRNLLRKVHEVMHSISEIAWIEADHSLREVVIAMTRFPLGAAFVVNNANEKLLLGIVTDGDIRRALEREGDIRVLQAKEIYSENPTMVLPGQTLQEALKLMEDRPRQISVLPVVESLQSKKCIGLIRIHDIFQPE